MTRPPPSPVSAPSSPAPKAPMPSSSASNEIVKPISLGWYSFLRRFQHLVGEQVDLVDRRVHVRCDADTLELGVHDRRVDDAVLIEQPLTELDVVDAIDLKQRNRSGLPVVERSQRRDPRILRDDSLRPAVAQVAQTCNLALGANASVECERGGDGVVIRGRMGSNLLVLANVVVLLGVRRHQRPEILLLLLPDVEEAGANGSEQPFVQARSVVIAVQVVTP